VPGGVPDGEQAVAHDPGRIIADHRVVAGEQEDRDRVEPALFRGDDVGRDNRSSRSNAESALPGWATGVPVEALAAAARKAGIRVRHGITSRPHRLAALGGPAAFPTDVWNGFTRPGAEQRICRLLAIPGQPSLQHAARQLGIRNAILTSQVRQIETTVGTALLRTGPHGRLTLTAYGQLFARDARPALESLAQSRNSKDDNHGTFPFP